MINFSSIEPDAYYAFGSDDINVNNILGSGNSRDELRRKYPNAQRILKGSTVKTYGIVDDGKWSTKKKLALGLGLGAAAGAAGLIAANGISNYMNEPVPKYVANVRDWKTNIPMNKDGTYNVISGDIGKVSIPRGKSILHDLGIKDANGNYGTLFNTVDDAKSAIKDSIGEFEDHEFDKDSYINSYYAKDNFADAKDGKVRISKIFTDCNKDRCDDIHSDYIPEYKKSWLGELLD